MTHELTTTSILALFDTTREQRQTFLYDLMQRIDDGDVNPLDIHLQIKCMEDIIKQLNDNPVYKAAILEESQKYAGGEREFEYRNAKIKIQEVGAKYDYSVCGDVDWELYNQAKLSAETGMKERQKFLQTLPTNGIDIVNKLTGEVETVYPPAKSSTTSIAVTLK